jgi:hypothetical protein
MFWILQENLFSEPGFERLIQALERFKLPHVLVKVVPFVGTLIPEPEVANPAIVMGSYSMSKAALKKGWVPGSFLNENLDYGIQLSHWGDRMLNSDAKISKFSEVEPRSDLFFLRPVCDEKYFVGQVFDWEEFSQWQAKVLSLGPENGSTLTGDTLVMASTAKVIYREYRVWVVQGKAITASLYKIGNLVRHDPLVEPDVLRFVEETAAIWTPIEAFVMDIADTREGYKIIEVNNLNSAGFYAGDMQKLVMALEDLYPVEPLV